MNQTSSTDLVWQRVPARKGAAAKMKSGQSVKIVNTSGGQVLDTWAFGADDIGEHMSMEHTRVSMLKLVPAVGDVMASNRRRPMLTLIEDTTDGIHDTLMAACDVHRYQLLGAHGYHDNCTDNLKSGLASLGLETPVTPSPFNLFMSVPVDGSGGLAFGTSIAAPGQYVTLRAEMDLIIVFSACPQDMIPVNNMTSADVHFAVF